MVIFVADDVLRGVPASDRVKANDRWEHVPAFLQLSENQWPEEVLKEEQQEID